MTLFHLVDDLDEAAIVLGTVEHHLEREGVGVEIVAALHLHPSANVCGNHVH
jgi:hypothetical protein